MANATNTIQRDKNLADTLATLVSDGTYSDVIQTAKVDAAGQEATATQQSGVAAQLTYNAHDDAYKRVVEMYFASAKTWKGDNLAGLEALGSDDQLEAFDLGFAVDAQILYYCASVDGAGASTWAVASGGAPTLAEVLATTSGNTTGGTDIEVSNGDAIVGEDGGSIDFPAAATVEITGTFLVNGIGLDPVDIQSWTTPGTYTAGVDGWTKPTRGTMAMIIVTGAGGGGAGGGGNTGSSARTGGCGGGGGAKHIKIIPLSLLGATETIKVGTGGAGGAGGNPTGSDGSDGTSSSFGTHAIAGAGGGGRRGTTNLAGAGGGGGGIGGNGSVGTNVATLNEGGPGMSSTLSTTHVGSSGGTGCRGGISNQQSTSAEWGGGGGAGRNTSANLAGGTSMWGGGGGGCGGNYSSGNILATAGGSSGEVSNTGGGGGAAGTNSTTAPTAGTAGAAASSVMVSGAGGGGGGGATVTAGPSLAAAVGGAGGFPGGGGGGGGAGYDTAGATGGSGGDGAVYVYVF